MKIDWPEAVAHCGVWVCAMLMVVSVSDHDFMAWVPASAAVASLFLRIHSGK